MVRCFADSGLNLEAQTLQVRVASSRCLLWCTGPRTSLEAGHNTAGSRNARQPRPYGLPPQNAQRRRIFGDHALGSVISRLPALMDRYSTSYLSRWLNPIILDREFDPFSLRSPWPPPQHAKKHSHVGDPAKVQG